MKEAGEILNLQNFFDAFSGDVITEYSFGFSRDNLLSEGFNDTFHDAFLAVSQFGHFALQFPYIAAFLDKLPHSWVKSMNPPLAKLLDLQVVSFLCLLLA
jgi:hypothetical protein